MSARKERAALSDLDEAVWDCFLTARRGTRWTLTALLQRLPLYSRGQIRMSLQRWRRRGIIVLVEDKNWKLVPVQKTSPKVAISQEDLDWMKHWQHHRQQRLQSMQQSVGNRP